MTSKHHEGWALWPTPRHANWNSMDTGPHLDLLHEVGTAVRARGLRFGFYYSLMEWDRLYTDNTGTEEARNGSNYVNDTMIPDLQDLVERYQPDVLYVDGEWSYPSDHWQTRPFLAWLFNDSPVRDTVAINDRWGNECRGKHGGFYVCEYGGEVNGSCITSDPTHPWTAHEGMGKSFGYNRLDIYKPPEYFVGLLVQSVAYGGHLQLNVGPTADGLIPHAQQEILAHMGRWLAVNGDAIYNTTGYPFGVEYGCTTPAAAAAAASAAAAVVVAAAGATATAATTTTTTKQCYTSDTASGDVFVMTSGWPGEIVFPAGALHPSAPPPASAFSAIGVNASALPAPFQVTTRGSPPSVVVTVPAVPLSSLPAASVASGVFAFRVEKALLVGRGA
jgi:alpha-L-fucosidase